MELFYSADRSTISIERIYCVLHFNVKNPPHTNIIKSLVHKFKTQGTVTGLPTKQSLQKCLHRGFVFFCFVLVFFKKKFYASVFYRQHYIKWNVLSIMKTIIKTH